MASRRKEIDRAQLEDLVSQGLKLSEISDILGASSTLILDRCREYGIDFTGIVRPNRKYKFEMDKAHMQQYLDMHMTYQEIADEWEKQTGEKVPDYVVSQCGRSLGLKSEGNRYYMQKNNPARCPEVKEKISATVSKLWESGHYADRVNGMTGLTEDLHPNFRPEGCSEAYLEKAKYYYPEPKCMHCGKPLSWDSSAENAAEVHHVDHNHDNYALTNLMPLCRSCHKTYHKKNQFFTTVTKEFAFDASHYLPFHNGKCKFIHGHTYHMSITVRNVILLETGMVIDFKRLKEIVEDNIIEKFDHGFLNEFVPYSTCECMVFWIWRQLSKDLKGIYKIRLQETDGSYAELTLDDYMHCISEFECAWHYSKGIDTYYIPPDHIINDGHSSFPSAEALCAHNSDELTDENAAKLWRRYDAEMELYRDLQEKMETEVSDDTECQLEED